MSTPPPFVSLWDQSRCFVEEAGNLYAELSGLSFARNATGTMELKSDSPMDDGEMAILGQKLANLGLAFAGGHGWPPFAVMAHLQERGLIAGVFHEIRWTSPNTWTVT